VHEGTPELYTAFPQARLLLFEPNPECQNALEHLIKRHGGRYWQAAAAQEAGMAGFWVRPTDSASLSSADSQGRQNMVPVVWVAEAPRNVHTPLPPPVILQVDVEGH
jgi:FkbM family methyltransferase